MPSTLYVHSNGRKVGQFKDGVRLDYLTDALGSVTATKNTSQAIERTFRYKPYGASLSSTGTGEIPKYRWTGNTGSRNSNLKYANQYNVYRHYGSLQAAWTTVDPLMDFLLRTMKGRVSSSKGALPNRQLYVYAKRNPSSRIDPSGLADTGSSTSTDTRLQGCVDMSFPLPFKFWGVCGLEVIAQSCAWCYDPHCCTPPVATRCTEMEFGIAAKCELSFESMLGLDELRDGLEMLLQFVVGLPAGALFVGLACGPNRARACVAPKEEMKYKFCVSACLWLSSIEGCLFYDPSTGSFGFDFEGTGGYCGALSISVQGKAEYTECK